MLSDDEYSFVFFYRRKRLCDCDEFMTFYSLNGDRNITTSFNRNPPMNQFYKDYIRFIRIYLLNSRFSAVIKILENENYLRDFVVSNKSSLVGLLSRCRFLIRRIQRVNSIPVEAQNYKSIIVYPTPGFYS